MTEWSAFFKTVGFTGLRQEQARMVSDRIYDLVAEALDGNPQSLARIQGELDMAKAFLSIPKRLAGEDLGHDQLVEDVSNITRYLMREHLLKDIDYDE